MSVLDRRELFKVATTGALFYVSACALGKSSGSKTGPQPLNGFELAQYSPMNRSGVSEKIDGFTGDDPHFAHQVLWDKDTFLTSKGGLPEEMELAEVVIVGGGVSGLTAALELADFKPIVLEQATRFGGNSKGESFEGLDYSIGAAYFTQPEKGSRLDKLLKQVGAYEIIRTKTNEDAMIFQNKILEHFWSGETVSKKSSKEPFTRLAKYFEQMAKEENGYVFPDIPIEDPEQRDYINILDGQSFHEHVKAFLDGEMHPHIEVALEHYCWSSFGASSKEISAAMGLNFFVGEIGNVLVARGGNAGVAEKIFFELAARIPGHHLRPSSLVFDVNHKDHGVEVSYVDKEGNVKTILTKQVIMACPKFVVAKILNNIEADRLELLSALKYRSYLVANILLKKATKLPYYDLFLLNDGKTAKVKDAKATDIVIANFADFDDKLTVLTMYRSFPRENVRAELLEEGAYDKYLSEFKAQFNELRGVLGFSEDDLIEYRLSRWGHPLPVAEKGLIRSGVIERLCKSFGTRVHFAEQDNWMHPCLETATFEAFRVSDVVRTKLNLELGPKNV